MESIWTMEEANLVGWSCDFINKGYKGLDRPLEDWWVCFGCINCLLEFLHLFEP